MRSGREPIPPNQEKKERVQEQSIHLNSKHQFQLWYPPFIHIAPQPLVTLRRVQSAGEDTHTQKIILQKVGPSFRLKHPWCSIEFVFEEK